MNEFINHTNHPSDRWDEPQRRAAEVYGVVRDLPFPAIPASWGEAEVMQRAEENARAIIAFHPAAVLVQGEFTYTYALVTLLKAAGLIVLSACSERHVKGHSAESGAIVRTSQFVFCRFRTY